MDKPLVICFLPNPMQEGRGAYTLRSNLHNVLNSISNLESDFDLLFLDITYYNQSMNLFLKAYYLMIEQLNNIVAMLKHRRNKTVAIFPMDVVHIFPILTAKFLGIGCIYFISGLAGSDKIEDVIKLRCEDSKYLCFGLSRSIFSFIYAKLESMNYRLSNILIVESPRLAIQLDEKLRKSKVILNGSLFVDTERFRPFIAYSRRPIIVGYFGALAKHKGVLDLIRAIPVILNNNDDILFIIGGDGPLFDDIKNSLKCFKLADDRVVLAGSIHHHEMPSYLNSVSLLIFPSYGEGMPNIVLESMACGTPVLATPVGGIPDLIIDGVNGFIMKNNSPITIAENIIQAIKNPKLKIISENSRATIEKDYTLKASMKRYENILSTIFPP